MTADDLAKLHARCFTIPRPWTAKEFTAFQSDANAIVLTDHNAVAVGRVIAGEGEVLTIAVDPEFQGQGAGQKILAELLAQMAGKGATEVFLEVSSDNKAALALYARAGFVQVGLRKAYYAGRDAFTLRKDAGLG